MSEKKINGENFQIVVSLPRRNGLQIKKALKGIAESTNRSLANLVVFIISSWLKDNGHPEEFLLEDNDLAPDKSTPEEVAEQPVEPERVSPTPPWDLNPTPRDEW